MGFIIPIGQDEWLGDGPVVATSRKVGWVELRSESFKIGINYEPTWHESRSIEFEMKDVDLVIAALRELKREAGLG